MQLKKLSPLTGLILTALLSACGGGGGDEPPPPAAPPPPPAITVSAITLTPSPIAQNALQFDGGVCGGGTGTLTAAWEFGDTTGPSGSNTHTYAETATGLRTVTVKCTDTAGTTPVVGTLDITVLTEAMKGFLGKTWSSYSRIDPLNLSTYPIAGIADSGDVSGVWIRRTAGNMEVAEGTTSFSGTSWAVSGVLPTGTDQSPFNDAVSGGRTAAIDQAVSPNGHVIAAWKAGTSIYAVKKSTVNGAWTVLGQFTFAGDPVTNESIKVVVNDAGDGAIAFCSDGTGGTQLGAYVIPYLNNTAGAAQVISNKCGTVDMEGTSTLQRSRAFDIAIDSSSKIYAAGVLNATSGAPKSAIVLQTNTAGAWAPTATAFADEIATAPESLSFSLSPNGNYAAIVWNQVSPSSPFKSNVYANVYAGSAWGTSSTHVQNDFITKNYTRPMVAINDSGVAFLAMRLSDTFGNAKTEVSNYDALATTPAWSSPYRASDYGFQAADVAIDKYGTGLLTGLDTYNTQAGTFTKSGTWSGFKSISPRYPYGLGSTFHYQTMRALPDGRAILVTSVYDDITAVTATTQPVASGYMLLK